MKKIIITICVGIIVVVGIYIVIKEPPFGGITFDNKINDIQTAQDAYFEKHGKYQQILKTDSLITGKEVEVHTLHHPDGTEGYRIIETWKDKKKNHIKSTGFGIHADINTYEIITVDKDKIATST